MRIPVAAIIVTGLAAVACSAEARTWQTPNSGLPALQEQTPKQSQGTQQESVAEAARKAREKAKTAAPAKKTYTNDTVSELRGSEISVVGSATSLSKDTAPDQAKPAVPPEVKKDETYWRKRFADLRTKLSLAEREVDVAQRELNLLQTQYYADPNKQLQQQLTRDDINDKTAKIDEKKAEVAKLTQALEDLKDELRHAGGEPGWAN
jgi:chromosome segregation ATPase